MTDSARAAFYNDPRLRGVFYQIGLLLVVLWIGYEFVVNARDNLRAARIATGFGFLEHTAGFSINQSLIAYSESDTYGRVFWVGLLNTLLVAAVGIVLATIVGFTVGICRLSANWLLQRIAGGYVELIRNVPLLFQILFWYLAVLGALPNPRQSLSLFGEVFLNNRGAFIPRPLFEAGAEWVIAALALAIVLSVAVRILARRRQERTGRQFPVLWTALALIVGVNLRFDVLDVAGVFVVIVVFAMCFSSLSMILASLLKTRDRMMGIGQAITMPLFFASNAIYPLSLMPPWLQTVSIFNPLSYVVDAVRAMILTGDYSNLLVDLGVLDADPTAGLKRLGLRPDLLIASMTRIS